MSATNGQTDLESALANLTRRETEVLGMIGRGMSLPEIAQVIHRSPKTVETHRLALGRKLGAANRVALARIAIRAGLAPLDDDGDDAAAPTPADTDELKRLRKQLATNENAWNAVHELDEDLSHRVGIEYFYVLVNHLTEALDARFAGVFEFTGTGHEIRTLASHDRELHLKHQVFDASHSPCWDVREQRVHTCDADARARYPKCEVLELTEANTFIAAALTTPTDEHLGSLLVAHDGPIDAARHPAAIVELCAHFATSELIRMKLETHLRETEP